MKILCAKSGVQFSCDHISAFLSSREISHPVFYLSQKKLIGLYSQWTAGDMPETDSYLLYLAWLNSTNLLHWASPAKMSHQTAGIVARNMNRAERICTRIPTIPRYEKVFASVCINHETADLENSHIFLDIWEANWKDYEDGYRKAQTNAKLQNLERALHIKIKNYSKGPESYAVMLARWASVAADFPTFQILHTWKKTQVTCSEYWQDLIAACVKKDAVLFLDSTVKGDLDELIEHVVTNLPASAVFAKELYDLLKSGKTKQTAFFGLGDLDLTSSKYRIMDSRDDGSIDVEAANKLALIDSAPKEKPVESSYPSKIAYLRAKLKWDMAVEYRRTQESQAESKGEPSNVSL